VSWAVEEHRVWMMCSYGAPAGTSTGARCATSAGDAAGERDGQG